MKFSTRIWAAVFPLLVLASPGQAQVLGGGGGSLGAGITAIVGTCTNGYLLYNNNGFLGCQAAGVASISIGSTITSSTAGYGLYVGTGGNAGLLEQFAYGTNVFAALGQTLNGSGAISATISPSFTTPALDAATGTSLALGGATLGGNALAVTGTSLLTGATNIVGALTLGTQQTTRSALVLANTAAGAFATTIESSNSATAASTLVLPVALAGSGPVVLTDAAGNGVLSWAAAPSSTLTVGSTATSGGAAGQLMFDTGSVLSESGNLVFASNVLTIGLSGTANGKVVLGNVTSGTSFLDAGVTATSTATLGTTTLTKFQLNIAGSNKYDYNVTGANYTTINSSLNVFGDLVINDSGSAATLHKAMQFGWGSGASVIAGSTPDTMFTRSAPAVIHLGAADAAAPVAQTLGVQSVVAGTTNTAGSLWTLTGSQSTGTGVGGDIVFKVAKAGSTGTAQNALTEAFRIAAATALPEWPSSTTAAGTQTFTNSPCSGLTSEQWVPIQITGQTGTWYVPACQ